MKHSLSIKVSKDPYDGIVSCYKTTMREKLLKLLLGDPIRLTVLVPGDTVDELDIKEVVKA